MALAELRESETKMLDVCVCVREQISECVRVCVCLSICTVPPGLDCDGSNMEEVRSNFKAKSKVFLIMTSTDGSYRHPTGHRT